MSDSDRDYVGVAGSARHAKEHVDAYKKAKMSESKFTKCKHECISHPAIARIGPVVEILQHAGHNHEKEPYNTCTYGCRLWAKCEYRDRIHPGPDCPRPARENHEWRLCEVRKEDDA